MLESMQDPSLRRQAAKTGQFCSFLHLQVLFFFFEFPSFKQDKKCDDNSPLHVNSRTSVGIVMEDVA